MKMKHLIKINIFVMFLFIFNFSAIAQETRQTPDKSALPDAEAAKQPSETHAEWQEVKLDRFYFLMPKDFQKIDGGRCYDGGCYHYGDKDSTLDIDISDIPYYPVDSETRYPDYKYNVYDVEGGKAWTWAFKEKNGPKYHAGVLYYLDKLKNKKIGIYLQSDKEDVYKIAEKIFNSVKFTIQK